MAKKKKNKSSFGGRSVDRPGPVSTPSVHSSRPLHSQHQRVTNKEPLPDLLTVSQACLVLGNISRSTLQRLERSGARLGRIKIGGVLRYDKAVLLEWIRLKVYR